MCLASHYSVPVLHGLLVHSCFCIVSWLHQVVGTKKIMAFLVPDFLAKYYTRQALYKAAEAQWHMSD